MPPRKTSQSANDRIAAIAPSLSNEAIVEMIKNSPGFMDVVGPMTAPKTQYPDNPIDFCEQTLHLTLTDKQKEIAQSVFNERLSVVSSGHSVGKSLIASAITAYWLSHYQEDAKVITIAPTHAQLEGVLWRYIRQLARKNSLPEHVFETPRWEIAPDRFAIGLSPKKATQEDIATIQGFHAKHLLVIMDEAAGLPRILWEAVQGLATGEDNKILAIGNPIEQSGPFWDACNSPNWKYTHISCLDHPNVVQHKDIIPGAVSWQWVDDRVNEWCVQCEPKVVGSIEWDGNWYIPMPIFQARVLGIAPEQGEDQLIKLSWVMAAEEREDNEIEMSGECIIGFDPAPRGGDDNAMCTRRGGKVYPIKRRKGYDTQVLAGWLLAETIATEAIKVYIDDVAAGAGVTDHARKLGLPVVAVNFGRAASNKKRWANLRSEAYWSVREMLREGKMALPRDSLLSADLTAPKFNYDEIGRVQLETKDGIKSRIGRSPDSGDALALTFSIAPAVGDDIDKDKLQQQLRTPSRSGGSGSRWIVTNKRPKNSSRWRR